MRESDLPPAAGGDPETTLEYEVDADGWILSVSQRWSTFASANGAPWLTRSRTVGHRLWDFIRSEPAERIHRHVHAHVLRTQESITYDYRCDAPFAERHMRMLVIPLPGERILYRSAILHSIPRDPRAVERLARGVQSSTLRQCSQCNRFAVDGRWLEIDEALSLVSGTTSPGAILQDLCEECRDEIWKLCGYPREPE